MNETQITQEEILNDGKTINLYYNSMIGMYVTYGFSAFFTSHIAEVVSAFSEDMQMPVAIVRKPILAELLVATVNHRQVSPGYYKLELKQALPLDEYSNWVNKIQQ